MKEIWKPIEQNEMYEVSNLGNVRSWYKKGGGVRSKPYILKQQENLHGYKLVSIRINGKAKTFSVSRLVGMHHVDGNKSLELNHIDGNKENNKADNLEWVTRSENMKHAFDIGLRINKGVCGEENIGSKLTENDVLQIRSIYQHGWFTHQEIADAYHISRRHAGNIIQNKRWAHI